MSGIIIPFKPRPRHGRTSADSPSNPKRARSARTLRLSNSRSKRKNFSVGMRPRDFQLETAGKETPASAAAAAGPPTASMTASMDVSIPAYSSPFVNMSSLHRMPIVTECEMRPNGIMSRSLNDLAKRLHQIETAIGKRATDICKDTGIAPNAWSQYKNPDLKRPITLDAAFKLKDAYGITLEFTFDGDRSHLSADIAEKLPPVIRSRKKIHNV